MQGTDTANVRASVTRQASQIPELPNATGSNKIEIIIKTRLRKIEMSAAFLAFLKEVK